jgi:hypothetical protein
MSPHAIPYHPLQQQERRCQSISSHIQTCSPPRAQPRDAPRLQIWLEVTPALTITLTLTLTLTLTPTSTLTLAPNQRSRPRFRRPTRAHSPALDNAHRILPSNRPITQSFCLSDVSRPHGMAQHGQKATKALDHAQPGEATVEQPVYRMLPRSDTPPPPSSLCVPTPSRARPGFRVTSNPPAIPTQAALRASLSSCSFASPSCVLHHEQAQLPASDTPRGNTHHKTMAACPPYSPHGLSADPHSTPLHSAPSLSSCPCTLSRAWPVPNPVAISRARCSDPPCPSALCPAGREFRMPHKQVFAQGARLHPRTNPMTAGAFRRHFETPGDSRMDARVSGCPAMANGDDQATARCSVNSPCIHLQTSSRDASASPRRNRHSRT